MTGVYSQIKTNIIEKYMYQVKNNKLQGFIYKQYYTVVKSTITNKIQPGSHTEHALWQQCGE